ncbi:MAG TPA: MoaD/ThiS family protein [Anaerolineales bacterium]
MPILRIPTPLRSYTDGQIEVRVDGRNIGEAMEALVAKYPTLKPHLYNGDGRLRPFVNLFISEHNMKDLDGLSTPVEPDTRVLLVPSIAGGRG